MWMGRTHRSRVLAAVADRQTGGPSAARARLRTGLSPMAVRWLCRQTVRPAGCLQPEGGSELCSDGRT